jgi:signal transduction histidine kinase
MPAHLSAADLDRIGADQPLLGQAQDFLKMQVVDVAGIVDEAVDASKAAIRARQQHLSVQLPSEDINLQGDPVRLAQTLCNLLENASKYTQMGGKIELSVSSTREKVQLVVSDNGRGITDEVLQSIFEPFMRGDDAGASNGGGLGLGLTLVRQFVEAHGGKVIAKSPGSGFGSQFVVTLPRAGPPVKKDAPAM